MVIRDSKFQTAKSRLQMSNNIVITAQRTSQEQESLYGVVVNPTGASTWVHQLFTAEEIDPLADERLGLEKVVVIQAGDFEGRTAVVRRIIDTSDFETINYYRVQGWRVPISAIAPPEKLARFQELDQVIDQFVVSWQSAAAACLEIDRDLLWEAAGYSSNRAYWMAKSKQAAEQGLPAMSYSRVMQLIGAAKTGETLEVEGIEVMPVVSSERAMREIARIPDEHRTKAAQALVMENQATGRPITEVLVKKASEEAAAGLTFEEVQMMFAPYGVFRRFSPTCRKNQAMRFQFEGQPGLGRVAGSLFPSLGAATEWFKKNLDGTPRNDMGCPTCTHCQWTAVDNIRCKAKDDLIGLTQIWNAPSWCGSYSPATLEQTSARLLPPDPANYSTVTDYLCVCHLEAEPDLIAPDEEIGVYRGKHFFSSYSEAGGLAGFSVQVSNRWYSAVTLPGCNSPLEGLATPAAIAYRNAVIDGILEIESRHLPAEDLTDVEAGALSLTVYRPDTSPEAIAEGLAAGYIVPTSGHNSGSNVQSRKEAPLLEVGTACRVQVDGVIGRHIVAQMPSHPGGSVVLWSGRGRVLASTQQIIPWHEPPDPTALSDVARVWIAEMIAVLGYERVQALLQEVGRF